MPDISKITLPSGSTYDIKDATAREQISSIQTSITGAMSYVGVTTTALADGDSTSTIVINSSNHTATAGDVAIYGDKEFVFNGSVWNEFGDMGSLKALAFKDTASATYTPAGSVSQPTFTGSAGSDTISVDVPGNIDMSYSIADDANSLVSFSSTADHSDSVTFRPAGDVSQPTFTGSSLTSTGSYKPEGSVTISSSSSGTANYTPAGTVSQPTFTGSSLTSTGSYQPEGSVTISTGSSGTANYTPAGSVSTPTITVTPSTTTVNSITAVGTLPAWSATVSSENLTFSWDTGTLPTKGSDTTVATGISSATSTQPTFTGTGAVLKGSFSGTSKAVSVSGTPEGTVSQPTFTGTGTVLSGSFSGTSKTVSVSGTPSGTVSQPEFTGYQMYIGLEWDDVTQTDTVSITPSGTVSQPTFTGTEATITVS